MRLFVGVPVPPSRRYAAAARELLERVPGRMAGEPHVTLSFLGDVDEGRVPELKHAIDDAVAAMSRMPCRVVGVGAFTSERHARIVWARVKADGLDALADAVRAATGDRDARHFRAHVTLARLKDVVDVRWFAEHHRQTVFSEGEIDRVVLYRSTLSKEGATYTRIHEAFLQ